MKIDNFDSVALATLFTIQATVEVNNELLVKIWAKESKIDQDEYQKKCHEGIKKRAFELSAAHFKNK